MRVLRSWRVEGTDGEIVSLEEHGATVAIVLERQGDLHRVWLKREALEALLGLRHDIRWDTEDE